MLQKFFDDKGNKAGLNLSKVELASAEFNIESRVMQFIFKVRSPFCHHSETLTVASFYPAVTVVATFIIIQDVLCCA